MWNGYHKVVITHVTADVIAIVVKKVMCETFYKIVTLQQKRTVRA